MVQFPAQSERPAVVLAPLAGITDLPFRNLVSGLGADMVVSEMVASQDIVNARANARDRAELGLGRDRTVVQLAGREARWMAEAARVVEGGGARRIDINMGCPAKKVVSGYSGSALMRDLDHALRLIEAVASSVEIPVSVKMRLGWDETSLNAPELARRAEAAGVALVTVHGRTRCQFYKGRADWRAVANVKRAVRIPVLVNGDITDAATAREALEQSGADGVMLGRGVRGRPWLPRDVRAALAGEPAEKRPSGVALVELITAHYAAALDFHGADLGLRTMRKHLGWYLDAAAPETPLRRPILTETDPRRVPGLVARALADPMREAA